MPTDRFHRLLGWWVVVAATVELVAMALNELGLHNVLLYNFYWPVEFALLLALSHLMHPWPRRVLLAVIVVFQGAWTANLLMIDPGTRLVNTSVIVGALMLASIYLLRLWHLANTLQARLRDSAAYWLCLAVLVYYGAAAPLLGSINYFLEVDMGLAQGLFSITRVLFLLKFALMAAACLRARTPVTTH